MESYFFINVIYQFTHHEQKSSIRMLSHLENECWMNFNKC